MDVVKVFSSRTDDLTWKVMFPFLCGVMMWFSIVLALVVRAGGGRRRRMLARRTLERYVLATPGTPVRSSAEGANTPTSASRAHPQLVQKRQHEVIVPTSIRLSTRAVVRRAVVVVGGDMARSPRMQYHATSLAASGLFDEIVLVGLDCGNHLSEALLKSGAPAPQTFYSGTNAATGQNQLDWEAYDASTCRPAPSKRGAVISTQYLVSPSSAPAWFEYIFPLKSLHWLACTAYRVMALSSVFTWLLLRAMCVRVNAHGQMLLTDLIVVQSPPAVPFVGIVKYIARPLSCLYGTLFYYCGVVPACWFHREAMRDLRSQCKPQRTTSASRYVFWPALLVDWHNYGYTILKADRRPAVAVRLYKALELGTCAGDINLTVSQAMRASLQSTRSIGTKPVVVLYDVAPAFFGPVERARFVKEVLQHVTATPNKEGEDTGEGGGGGDTWGINPPPQWVYHDATTSRKPRGLVVVGSTSWTPDDDYTILIEALQRLDVRLQHVYKYRAHGASPTTSSPRSSGAIGDLLDVWVLITGKGPARRRFEDAVRDAGLSSHIAVSTLYLQSYDQYSVTLGAADVGLCLHFSSSGLDLPMKGVDMVGSGLPVAALRYPAVGELMMDEAERRAEQTHTRTATTTATATTATSSSNSASASSQRTVKDVQECTRGWLFQTSSGLERLLSHLVGLDAHCERLRDIVLLPAPSREKSPTTANLAAGARGHGGGSGATYPLASPVEAELSSLEVMRSKARQARASALTWEENWNDVAFPLIYSVL